MSDSGSAMGAPVACAMGDDGGRGDVPNDGEYCDIGPSLMRAQFWPLSKVRWQNKQFSSFLEPTFRRVARKKNFGKLLFLRKLGWSCSIVS
ncbi:unnamed protein product [Strongylus vulgaris]|uniref:Uncharacterized protein n=1 Tax=Strongylus vulgaris TaxID=40348 RepID=A0A3P7KRG8_STRVU|nr:unnamed protein product [Strongylus vulgaris]